MKKRQKRSFLSCLQRFIWTLFLSWVCCSVPVWAVDCDAVFSDGAQSHDSGGKIDINNGVSITGTDGIFDTSEVSGGGAGSACNGSACTASGSTSSSSTPAIQTGSGSDGDLTVNSTTTVGNSGDNDFKKITVENNKTLTFSASSSVYYIEEIDIKNNTTINLAPVDYWVDGNVVFGNGSVVAVSGSPTARLFVNGSITIENNVDFNKSGDASQLLIYATGDISVKGGVELKGYLYAGLKVDISNGASIEGAVSGKDVVFGNNSSLVTDVVGLTTGNFGDFCDALVLSPVAHWQMDEASWSGSAGEVTDSSGNGLNGVRVGNAQTSNTTPDPARSGDPGTCRYGEFDANGDYLNVDDNNLLDLSSEFTITAWARPESTGDGAEGTIINKGGLGILVNYNYRIQFNNNNDIVFRWCKPGFLGLCSNQSIVSSSSLSLNTWTHIAASYKSGEQKLYFNGVEVASGSVTGSVSTVGNALRIGSEDFLGAAYHEFDGQIDQVQVHSTALSSTAINVIYQETQACSTSCVLGSFTITQPTYTLACPDTRAAISITAMCTDGVTTKTDYTGTANLTSSVAGSSFYDAVSGGSPVTSTTFVAGDVGQKTVYLYHNNEDSSVKVTANDTSASVSTTAATGTDFRAFGFNIKTQPQDFSCGNTTSLTLQAYGKTDNAPGGSCEVITGFSGNKNLDVWFRADIDNDAAQETVSTSMSVNSVSVSEQTSAANNNVTVNFSAGESTFNVAYANTAKILDLNFEYDDDPYDGSPFSAMASSTNSFVASPSQWNISAMDGATVLNNTTTAGTPILGAGQSFNVSITAQCSGPTTATDYQPNTGSNTLMAYTQRTGPSSGGSEGGFNISASTTLTSSLSATPSWGSTEIPSASFMSGVYSYAAASYSEVGLIRLHIKDQNYYGVDTPSSTLDIGRFTPNHFTVAVSDAGTYQNTCTAGVTAYTYIGQPFSYGTLPELTISARALGGGLTKNYSESGYMKLLATGVTRNFPTADNAKNGKDGVTPMVVSSSSGDGVVTTTATAGEIRYTFFANDSFTYTKNANSLVDPFTSALITEVTAIQDSDAVAATGLALNVTPTGNLQRYGRWFLDNAFGPENMPLKIPMQTMVWNGVSYDVNADDSCTTYQATDLQVVTNNLNNSGTTSASGATTTLANGVAPLANQLELSAPGLTHDGSVDVEYQGDSWLMYDKNGDEVPGENAGSTVTFGRYRGHDRILYWREVSN